jgi:hypothetical protein
MTLDKTSATLVGTSGNGVDNPGKPVDRQAIHRLN